jgi:hypothetical protein
MKNHLDFTGIVWIDDARQGIQTMLYGKSRARRNTSICSWRELNRDACRDDHAAAREDDVTISAE